MPCPPLGDFPNPGIEPRAPTLQTDALPSEPPGKSEELSSQKSDAIFLRFYKPIWLQSPDSIPHSIPSSPLRFDCSSCFHLHPLPECLLLKDKQLQALNTSLRDLISILFSLPSAPSSLLVSCSQLHMFSHALFSRW